MDMPSSSANTSRVRIAIDGPAGAGKSTVAKMVSDLTGYVYVDTGGMYRGLALAALERDVDLEREEELAGLPERCGLSFRWDTGDFRVFLGARDVTEKLHSREVDGAVKVVARFPLVRQLMVKMQRGIAASNNVVMEGRDITSVVLPDAEVKIYLTAEFRERVRRRWQEMVQKGEDVPWDDLKREMAARDEADVNRKTGPLVRVSDAVVIDSTGKTAREVALTIVKLCDERNAPRQRGAGNLQGCRGKSWA